MKALRTAATPTRNRRLNEILGLMVLAAAALMLLALVSYTPTDASLSTVGGDAGANGVAAHAHNWTGVFGAYLSDALLQVLGIAVFLFPGPARAPRRVLAALARGGLRDGQMGRADALGFLRPPPPSRCCRASCCGRTRFPSPASADASSPTSWSTSSTCRERSLSSA